MIGKISSLNRRALLVLMQCYILIITSATISHAQVTVDSFLPLTYTDNQGNSLPYRLFIPTNYDATKSYPLVLFLCGAGGRGNDNRGQLTDQPSAMVFAQPQNQSKWPCFMVAPQCPVTDYWVNMPYWMSSGTYPANPTTTMTVTQEIVNSLLSQYSIDPHRLYVTGLSIGGFGTWDSIIRYPGKFAAAIPIAGGGDPDTVENIQGTAIWAFHSTDDGTVNVGWTQRMVAALRANNANPLYTEYNGYGHFSWIPAYSEPDLLPWLFDGTLPTVPALTDNAGGNQTVPASANGLWITGTDRYQTPNLPLPINLLWSQSGGPATINFSSATSPAQWLSFPQPGLYTVNLSATDGASLTTSSSASIAVQPGTPIANAVTKPGSITISWQPIAGATSYSVYRGRKKGAEAASPYKHGIKTTSLVDVKAQSGLTYYYTVAAFAGTVQGLQSADVSAKAK